MKVLVASLAVALAVTVLSVASPTPVASAVAPGCPAGTAPFDDSLGSFASTDIACIYRLGITRGTSATTFSPLDSVTRRQMAAFLARLW